jgi:Na+-transporting NADH:ubiquinone oxidoreductase subunit NqrB
MAPATASLVSVAALSFVAAILSRAFTAIEKLPVCIPAAVLSAASLFMKEEFTQFPAVSGKFDGEAFAHGVYPITALIAETTPDNQWYELFFGSVCGPMGAVSVLLIIAGAVYLLVRRIASLKVAASFMAGCAVCAYFVTGSANPFEVVLYTCLTGQFLFGAVFLASLPAWRIHDGRFDILLPAIGGALAVYLAFNVTLLSVPIAVLAMGVISSVIKLLPPSQPPFGSA